MKDFLKTPKYANDISYAGASKQQINKMKKKVPEPLKKFQSTVKTNKVERFIIPSPPPLPPKPPNMETLISTKATNTNGPI